MGKFILLNIVLCILFIPVFSIIQQYEHTFPIEFVESHTYVSIDEEAEISDPLDMLKAYAGFNAGTSPVELYADLKVKVIWDTDSVLQGNYFTVRIVTAIEKGDNPSIYTNYGIAAGVGVNFRAYGPFGGPWVSGPGYGLDFNFNIESEDNPPALPSDEAKGDDVVDFLSLIPDIGGGGTKSFILSDRGDTLFLKAGSEGSGASDVMGLFDILSLRLSAGLKTELPKIVLRASPDYSLFHGTETQWDYSLGDTFFYTVFIDSFIPTNTMAFINISDPKYFLDLYRRIGLCLQSFGFTVASSYWLDEDFYEFLGRRTLEIPYQLTASERYFSVPIKIIGQPILNPDLFVSKTAVFSKDAFGNATNFTEENVTTEIRIIIYNMGSSHSDTTSMEIAWDDSVKYIIIPPIDYLSWLDQGIFVTFTEPGDHILRITPNYDQSCDEFNFSNNYYARKIKVIPQSKYFSVTLRDKTNNALTQDNIDLCTFQTSYGIDTFRISADTLFYAFVPSGENMLINFVPDSSLTDYYYTSKYIQTDSIPLSGYTERLRMNLMGSIIGTVLDPKGDPLDSATIDIGAYSVQSDNGSVIIDQLSPLPSGYEYSMHISHPYFLDLDTTISVLSGDTTYFAISLISLDSVVPSGTCSFSTNVRYIDNLPLTGIGNEIGIDFTASDDYSGLKCVEIMNNIEGIWHRFDFDKQGEDTTLYVSLLPDQPVNNEWVYLNYRFTDLGGNTSTGKSDSIIVVSSGPSGNINAVADTVFSPNVEITLSASDTLCNVFKVYTGIFNFNISSFLYDGENRTIPIPTSSGVYQIFAVFENEMGVRGDTVFDTIHYIDIGDILINNGDEYSNSNEVELVIYPKAVSAGINDISGYFDRGGYPSLQTFVPNCSSIGAISIYFSFLDSLDFSMALFTDSTDGLYDHIPGHILSECTVYEDSSAGWYYGVFDTAVNVSPTDTYQIVLFRNNLDESFVPFTAAAVDDSRYGTGTYYYAPTMNMWIAGGFDLAFKIYTSPDSFIVSNSSDFSIHNSYTDESILLWSLNPGEGEKLVFAKSFYNMLSPGLIYDGIIIDTSAPEIYNVRLNKNNLFTTEPYCSIAVSFKDNYSEFASIDINNGEYTLGFIESDLKFRYNFPDSVPGTKHMHIILRDHMGNECFIDTFIDYDPSGAPISACFDNSDNYYIKSRYPTLNISPVKSITPEFMRYSEDMFNMGEWKLFTSSVKCTLDAECASHIMRIEIKDNYGQIKTSAVSAFVDSTPPGNIESIDDEGDFTESSHISFSWAGVKDDSESRLKSLHLILNDLTLLTQSDSLYLSPYVNTYTFTANLNRYHNYSAAIVSQNNAGLYADPIYSNGIILNYSPSAPILLMPESNDSTGTRPVFLLYANDNDSDTTLCFSIEISDDSSFSSIIRTFNGKINTSGWNRNRYTSYDTAQYIVSSADSLMLGHTYFWRALTHDSVTSSTISSIKPFTVQYCSGILPDFALAPDDSVFSVHITNIITGTERAFINLISPFSGYTEIYIYDIKGSRIKTFLQSPVNKGGYRFTWDLRDDYNCTISTGIYFIYAVSNNNIITKQKFEILK